MVRVWLSWFFFGFDRFCLVWLWFCSVFVWLLLGVCMVFVWFLLGLCFVFVRFLFGFCRVRASRLLGLARFFQFLLGYVWFYLVLTLGFGSVCVWFCLLLVGFSLVSLGFRFLLLVFAQFLLGGRPGVDFIQPPGPRGLALPGPDRPLPPPG